MNQSQNLIPEETETTPGGGPAAAAAHLEGLLTATAGPQTPRGRDDAPWNRKWNVPGEGEARGWASVPEFVKYVEAEQSSIKRKPVDRRSNPTLGGAWGFSVHHEHQSQAYRCLQPHTGKLQTLRTP